MKNGKFLQLALQRSFIFFFLGNIKQDTLPIKRISVCITNDVRIFLHPYDSPITPDKSIFFEKTGAILRTSFVLFGDSLAVLRMDGLDPQVRVRLPFFK